jgi:hypothetical protein
MPRARDREERHRLGEAVDRGPPFLVQEEQDRGDERAGVPDPDPPDEVDDREAPGDGDVDAPDPTPFERIHAREAGAPASPGRRPSKADPPEGGCMASGIALILSRDGLHKSAPGRAPPGCRRSWVRGCSCRGLPQLLGCTISRQIGRPRAGVELAEQAVVCGSRLSADTRLAGSATLPKTIASPGAGLLAGRADLAVADRPPGDLGVIRAALIRCTQ